MEFYAQTLCCCSVDELQHELTIPRLPNLCEAIDKLLEHDGDRGKIYCLWGEFSVHREMIRNGIRYTLPGCPNTLAWTVTLEQGEHNQQHLLIHCTINQRTHDPDFIESIEYFVAAWQQGLENAFGLDAA